MGALLLALARTVPLAWVGVPVGARWAKLLVGAALAAVVLPAAARADGSVPLIVLVIREVTVGLALGLVTAVPFRAAEAAGGIVDAARRKFAHGELARGYRWLALALFGAAGGPAAWVDALGESYAALPVGRPVSDGSGVVIEAVGRLIVAAVELSAPALAATLAASVVIGLLERSAPSLAASGGGRAARDLAGLLAVAASAAAVAAALTGGAGALGREIVQAARSLAG
jgi:flagellar biosynthesis protein FliR